MNKERLEEIEKRVFSRTFHTGLEVDMITIPERDYIYLKEQAERVRGLERDCKFGSEQMETLAKNHNRLDSENKRYREALEFYASKETYEHVLRSEAVYENGICISPPDLEPPVIYFDKGEIARKALEEIK